MHKLLSLVIITLLSTPCTATEPDKKKHFWAVGTISAATYLTVRQAGHGKKVSYLAGIGAGMVVGILKETYDHFNGLPKSRFDFEDLEYDLLGAVSVPLLVVSF